MVRLSKFLFASVAVATHYEAPPCASDEIQASLQGLTGSACFPKCDASGSCTTDVPTGTTAAPTCAIQDQSGNKYCGLICKTTDECPTSATCEQVPSAGVGICMYAGNSTTTMQPGRLPVEDFNQYKADFKKEYASVEEELKRFSNYVKSVITVEAHNALNLPYKFGINQFSDMTKEEFKKNYMGYKKPTLAQRHKGMTYLGRHVNSNTTLPASVDWTTKNVVTPVKNQGQCGSCWAFSTTGSLEGQWAKASGNLVSLSEQQFVDCSTQNNGCNGGLMDYAFAYAEKNAICTEESYAYTAADGTCKSSSCTTGIPSGSVTGFKDVTTDSEQDLMDAVANMGPTSIAIEADQSSFQNYQSGVLTAACGTSLDHGVLVVGYGTLSGTDYWKVKNSWGSTWGDAGYILLERGNKQTGGECGILADPSYPQVKASESVVVV